MTTLADEIVSNDNLLSLREAIAASAAGDTIDFAPGLVGTLTLTSGELSIGRNLTITGPINGRLIVSGNNASRVFNISGGTVNISNLTTSNGRAAGANGVNGNLAPGFPGGDMQGGGIFNSGTLTLMNCTLNGNAATGGSGNGGGIFNQGTLHLINCTLSGNSAAGGPGGFVVAFPAQGGTGGNGYGGALFNQGTLTLTHCTFSSNSVTSGNGGTGNPFGDHGSGNGGGLYNSAGSIPIGSSIIAGNSAVSASPDVAGAFISSGYNLIGKTDGSSGFVNGVNLNSDLGQRYRIEHKDALAAAAWTTVEDNLVGTGMMMQVPDMGAGTLPKRFYRGLVLP